MVSRKIKFCLALLVLSFFILDVHGEELNQDGRENYLTIKRMYDKWDSGLFGSRRYYRKRLYRLLIDMIGRDIQTGKDYSIVIPDVFEKRYYSSDLFNCGWLHIHGAADQSSVKELEEKDGEYIKEVERNKHLFFLSGRIERFRIIETGSRRYVHLYLESVKIRESIK